MAMLRPALMATTLALSLSGCGAAGLRTISSDVDPGDFGSATMNNSLVQTGARDATAALQQRFAGEVQSTITFDFNSSTLTPEAMAVNIDATQLAMLLDGIDFGRVGRPKRWKPPAPIAKKDRA